MLGEVVIFPTGIEYNYKNIDLINIIQIKGA
jgi:hypothetical protein